MLAVLLHLLFTLWACTAVGLWAGHGLLRLDVENRFHYTGLGFIALAAGARLWAFTGPVSWAFVAVVAAAAIVGTARHRAYFPPVAFFRRNRLLLGGVGAFLFFFCAQQSISYDEALYHASFIRWMADYGHVHGLANLHGRLGFNSTWHVLAAGLSMRWLGHGPINALNASLLVWGVCFFATERDRLSVQGHRGRIAALCLALLFVPLLLIYHLIDPSADLALAVWMLVLLYETSALSSQQSRQRGDVLMLLSIAALFLVTVKASAMAALLLLVGWALWKMPRRRWLQITAVSILLIGLWLASNYLLSGYLLFPSVDVPAWQPLWKVPHAIAAHELAGIRYGPVSRWAGISIEEAARLTTTERYRALFAGLRGLDKAVFLGAPLLLVAVAAASRRLGVQSRDGWLALGIATAGYALAILTAPDFRFVAPFFYFPLALLAAWMLPGKATGVLVAFTIPLCLAATLFLYHRLKPKVVSPASNRAASFTFNPIFPEPYPVTPHDTLMIDGINFRIFDERAQQFNWDDNPGLYAPVVYPVRLINPRSIPNGFFILDAAAIRTPATAPAR